jgi:hypothetical protein
LLTSESKVNQLYLVIVDTTEHDVLWLDISVDDAHLMAMIQSHHDLLHHESHF